MILFTFVLALYLWRLYVNRNPFIVSQEVAEEIERMRAKWESRLISAAWVYVMLENGKEKQ